MIRYSSTLKLQDEFSVILADAEYRPDAYNGEGDVFLYLEDGLCFGTQEHCASAQSLAEARRMLKYGVALCDCGQCGRATMAAAMKVES